MGVKDLKKQYNKHGIRRCVAGTISHKKFQKNGNKERAKMYFLLPASFLIDKELLLLRTHREQG